MANMTNPTASAAIGIGSTVRVWTGERGTVRYLKDGWYGIQLDGESFMHEWQVAQVEAA